MNVPFDRVIWGAQECADYIGLSRQEFLRTIRHKPDFPRELPNLPRRWQAIAVTEWALGKGQEHSLPQITQQAA